MFDRKWVIFLASR